MSEIIIDGVNVAECYNLIKSDLKKPICKNGGLRGGNRSHLCEDNNDCYFRQLQRAKAENEKLKQALIDIKVDFINHNARNGITKFENEIFLKIDKLLCS